MMSKPCYGVKKSSIAFGLILFGFASALQPYKREADVRPICKCGSNLKPLQRRVVGGKDASLGDFPYATALVPVYSGFAQTIYGKRSYTPYCGGTLISDRHIVTAAHCVRDTTPSGVCLDIGEYNIVDETESRTVRYAKSFTMHPSYDSKTFQNDIAIIELKEPVELGPELRSAWLPLQGYDINPGTPVVVYGWGKLDYDKPSRPKVLQMLEMPVVSRSDCQENLITRITPDMICAGGEEGKDACVGDSGSGLMVNQRGDNVLCGIVSFGKRCALAGVAGGYTKVSSYTDWIYENTRNAGCQPCVASLDEEFV